MTSGNVIKSSQKRGVVCSEATSPPGVDESNILRTIYACGTDGQSDKNKEARYRDDTR